MFLKGEAGLASVSFISQVRTEDDGREGHSEKEIQSQWHSEPANPCKLGVHTSGRRSNNI